MSSPTDSSGITAIRFSAVSRRHRAAGGETRVALDDVSFAIAPGRKVAVTGRSGSGKSTLLSLAAGIDLPSQGSAALFGRELSELSDRQRTALRRDHVGLVFQFFYLQGHLSVWENVALPELIAGTRRSRYRERVDQLLERVGLDDRRDDSVEKLSGGEQQRVALCRALVRRPRLLLADEPTGSLDDETGRQVMALLLRLVEEESSTLLYVTHSSDLAAAADQVLELRSGRLVAP